MDNKYVILYIYVEQTLNDLSYVDSTVVEICKIRDLMQNEI